MRARFRTFIYVCAVIGLAGSIGSHAQGTLESFGSGDDAFSIEFVTIDDPGNPGDPLGAPMPEMGSVPYSFRISKYEISNAQVEKAVKLGKLPITISDPNYTPPSWGPNKPATHLTFYEAMRFVNWLNTSSGYPPAYNFDAEGQWQLWPSDVAWRMGGDNRYRHQDAMYFLAGAHEWYKAAYYDPSRETYFPWPTGSRTTPESVRQGTAPNTLVYLLAYEDGPADVDNCGGLSPYGTMGQGGNLFEWTDTAVDGVNDSTSELLQVRGGRWYGAEHYLGPMRDKINPAYPWNGAGDTVTLRVVAKQSEVVVAPVLVMRRASDGEKLELAFESLKGIYYDVERSTELPAAFVTVDSVAGTDEEIVFPVSKPAPGSTAFYRVVATRVP